PTGSARLERDASARRSVRRVKNACRLGADREAGEKGRVPLIRFVTHMEWALEDRPGVGDLLEYEARANYLWLRFVGPFNPVICAYDLTKFAGDVVIDVMRTHPLVIVGGILQENPFFVPPDEFLRELCGNGANPDALHLGRRS